MLHPPLLRHALYPTRTWGSGDVPARISSAQYDGAKPLALALQLLCSPRSALQGAHVRISAAGHHMASGASWLSLLVASSGGQLVLVPAASVLSVERFPAKPATSPHPVSRLPCIMRDQRGYRTLKENLQAPFPQSAGCVTLPMGNHPDLCHSNKQVLFRML